MDVRRVLRSLICLAVFQIAAGPTCRAQFEKGAVTGTISDSSGATVPNAKVVLTDLSTGRDYSAATDESGGFHFAPIPIGRYSLRAWVEGSGTFRSEIEVKVDETSRVDITLSFGAPGTTASPSGVEPTPREETAPLPPPPPLEETAPPPPPPPLPRPLGAAGSSGESGKKNYVKLRVFYATDRQPSGSQAPSSFYSNKRNSDGTIALGACDVSIPRDHRVGKLESPKWWKLQFSQDPNKDVVLLAVHQESEGKFYGELASNVRASSEKKAFVFVHGYDVTFEDAARRTAQLAYDLQFHGAPIFYSWPSKGTLAGYPADEATIEWVRPHLKTFLQQVAARSEAKSIYLVAHSMGNRALTGALQDIVAESRGESAPHFREVILAAPDIDAGVFRQLSVAIESAADRVTLYASSNDKALRASKGIHDFARAGESGASIVIIKGIDTIDVSALDTGFLGHSYVADNTSVITDMFYLIAGVPAVKRVCLSAANFENLSYWLYGPPGAVSCPTTLPQL